MLASLSPKRVRADLANLYASRVVAVMEQDGLKRTRTILLVQGSENFVRAAHREGVPAEKTARALER